MPDQFLPQVLEFLWPKLFFKACPAFNTLMYTERWLTSRFGEAKIVLNVYFLFPHKRNQCAGSSLLTYLLYVCHSISRVRQ